MALVFPSAEGAPSTTLGVGRYVVAVAATAAGLVIRLSLQGGHMLELADLLAHLSQRRPVFHSEADLQHALAWEIHTHHPAANIRLEYRPANVNARMYVDIWARFPNGTTAAIELKYKTRRFCDDHGEEAFRLLDQSAQDNGRYDFLRDIARLEEIAAAARAVRGTALILTNDPIYWTAPAPRRIQTADAAFRIHEGRTLEGELAWLARALPPREAPIRLAASYRLAWSAYSQLPAGEGGREFRFLLVNVVSGQTG